MKEMMVKVGDKLPPIPDGYDVVICDIARPGDLVRRTSCEPMEWCDVGRWAGDVFSVLLRKKSDPLLEWANGNEKFRALAGLVRDGYGLFVDPDGDPQSGWWIQCVEKSKSDDLAVLDLGVPPNGVKAAPLRYDNEKKSWVRA